MCRKVLTIVGGVAMLFIAAAVVSSAENQYPVDRGTILTVNSWYPGIDSIGGDLPDDPGRWLCPQFHVEVWAQNNEADRVTARLENCRVIRVVADDEVTVSIFLYYRGKGEQKWVFSGQGEKSYTVYRVGDAALVYDRSLSLGAEIPAKRGTFQLLVEVEFDNGQGDNILTIELKDQFPQQKRPCPHCH